MTHHISIDSMYGIAMIVATVTSSNKFILSFLYGCDSSIIIKQIYAPFVLKVTLRALVFHSWKETCTPKFAVGFYPFIGLRHAKLALY